MAQDQNPETLHDKGQSKGMKTTPAFVNPGTPVAPLVTEKDIPSPIASAKGTQDLRDNMIK